MRAHEATPPLAFSPLKSEFNDFLFAPIGEEKNGVVLTVLSALARLGVDPWQESASLGQLSPDKAAQRLGAIISGLPKGRWTESDAETIAARLVGLLPAKRASRLPSLDPASRKARVPSRLMAFLFVAAIGGLMFFAVANYVHPAAVGNGDRSSAPIANSPQVPLPGSR
ncbi:MAG: hypothetical protein ACREFL_07090 [Stellaceae bacterium]